MTMLKQPPTNAHLSRMYYELAGIGAECVGEKKTWPYDIQSPEELLALACDMSRFDPRLVDILVGYFSKRWMDVNPARLRNFYGKMQTPQTVAVICEFLLESAEGEELKHFVAYLMAGLKPVAAQFYFRDLYSVGGRLAQRAAEEGLFEYKKWGFLACERPFSMGTLDAASRRNILRRLFEKKGEVSLKDYLSAVQFSVSRQQALLDIKSSGMARGTGQGRGAKWKLAA